MYKKVRSLWRPPPPPTATAIATIHSLRSRAYSPSPHSNLQRSNANRSRPWAVGQKRYVLSGTVPCGVMSGRRSPPCGASSPSRAQPLTCQPGHTTVHPLRPRASAVSPFFSPSRRRAARRCATASSSTPASTSRQALSASLPEFDASSHRKPKNTNRDNSVLECPSDTTKLRVCESELKLS